MKAGTISAYSSFYMQILQEYLNKQWCSINSCQIVSVNNDGNCKCWKLLKLIEIINNSHLCKKHYKNFPKLV